MTTLIYTHSACLGHRPGTHHPESPERLLAVLEALKTPEFADVQWRNAPLGMREHVLLVHAPEYVESVEALSSTEGLRTLDAGDTVMSPGTLEAVMRCVGAACAAVDAVVGRDARNAFCATRPCGHHAEADRAMGFCVFNQAAIAALHACEAHGLKRVAVVDFDVHHGNGTQNASFRNPDLFYTAPATNRRSIPAQVRDTKPALPSSTFRSQGIATRPHSAPAWQPTCSLRCAGLGPN